MNSPSVFFAYAPRGAGLLCAVAWFARNEDIFGWWCGARATEFSCAYFLVENFYAGGGTRLLATDGGDLYGGWTRDYTHRQPPLAEPIPVDDNLCHELERLQFQFSSEWLVYPDQADAPTETAAYREAELSTGSVLVRYKKLNKFLRDDAVWSYSSPAVDRNLVDYVSRRWPLDYRQD